MPVWQRIIATVVHRGLNILVLALGLSGIGLFVQSGVAAVVFGGNGGNLPNFDDFPARYVHGAFARLLFLLLALHIFAAFFHQFAKRDRIFARIGIGRP
jgi:cytochrome b561